MSQTYTPSTSFDMFFSMQCNFSHEVAQGIFTRDTEHFWVKWVRSHENIITFLGMLDAVNRKKVLEWGIESYTDVYQ